MDNGVKEISHVSSDEETPLHRLSKFDKQSRNPTANTDSPWRRGETGIHQKAVTGASSDYQRSLLRMSFQRPGAVHVQDGDESGDIQQRHQSPPKSSRKRKGILPRMTHFSRLQKAGSSRYPQDSDTTRLKSNNPFSRSRSSHEELFHEDNESRQISRSSSERVRRRLPQNAVHDTARHHGRSYTRIAKSRTWNEDTHRPVVRDDTEGELDGFFRFVGSLSSASWRLLTRIPDALFQLTEGTVRLLEHILPCFGRPGNLVADE